MTKYHVYIEHEDGNSIHLLETEDKGEASLMVKILGGMISSFNSQNMVVHQSRFSLGAECFYQINNLDGRHICDLYVKEVSTVKDCLDAIGKLRKEKE